jgi:ATP-binding cassette, subfamily C (CFTR/MRP), member 1
MVVGGAKQSGLAHQQITKGLLYASLTEFYNRVPTGRIVNRLTKDLRELDEALMNSLTFVLTNLFELFGILSICIYTTSPLTLIPILAMAWLARRLRNYYLAAQREVARLEKSTNSPVVSGFLSAIQGLPSIRSFGKGESFLTKQMECFDVNKQVRLTRAGL